MDKITRMQKPVLFSALVCGVAFALVGCPLIGAPTNGANHLTLVLKNSATPVKAGPVSVGDIESLLVTITRVTLDRAGTVYDDENEEESGEKKQIEVFSGELEVDLMDLTELSEVLSSEDVPEGKYTKIRLEIENPRLYLASDPETEITDVKLTANGRVFVSRMFELPPNQSSLIVLDFSSLHLVENGNGRFVLTPQLRAEINVQSDEARVAGEISEVDPDNDRIVVDLGEDGEVSVTYTDAVIYLPGDTDTPTGTESDLVVGLSVEVEGTLFVDGSVRAAVVVIL